MLGYIAFNLGESARVEAASARELRSRGIEPTLIVASPPPFAFWRRSIEWRSADRFGEGLFDFRHGLVLARASQPLGLDDPALARAKASERRIRSFLVWSRMPIVVRIEGRTYLTDQRFHNSLRSRVVPNQVRGFFRHSSFLVPLDNPPSSS
jgi:inner membrane protein